MSDYVKENAKFKIFDIIKDRVHIIVIDRIKWSSGYGGNNPHAVYYGRILTKKLKPRKDGDCQQVFEDSAMLVNKGDKQ